MSRTATRHSASRRHLTAKLMIAVARSQPSRQQQTQIEGIPDSELEFQEQLIQEREGEIEQIEQGISELNQIFKDLGQIVTEQGSMIGTLLPSPRNHDCPAD